MAFHVEAILDHNTEIGKHAEHSGLAMLQVQQSEFGEDEET